MFTAIVGYPVCIQYADAVVDRLFIIIAISMVTFVIYLNADFWNLYRLLYCVLFLAFCRPSTLS